MQHQNTSLPRLSFFVLFGLFFLVALQGQSLAAPSSNVKAIADDIAVDIAARAPPHTGSSQGGRNPPGRQPPRPCRNPTCDEFRNNRDNKEDDVDIPDDVPKTIETSINEDTGPPLPSKGAEAKIKKMQKPDPPGQPSDARCYGEVCVKRPSTDHPYKEDCTHMAGRKYEPGSWTCCPEFQFADMTGACCDRLGPGNQFCLRLA